MRKSFFVLLQILKHLFPIKTISTLVCVFTIVLLIHEQLHKFSNIHGISCEYYKCYRITIILSSITPEKELVCIMKPVIFHKREMPRGNFTPSSHMFCQKLYKAKSPSLEQCNVIRFLFYSWICWFLWKVFNDIFFLLCQNVMVRGWEVELQLITQFQGMALKQEPYGVPIEM